jgi:hypothetical protein
MCAVLPSCGKRKLRASCKCFKSSLGTKLVLSPPTGPSGGVAPQGSKSVVRGYLMD